MASRINTKIEINREWIKAEITAFPMGGIEIKQGDNRLFFIWEDWQRMVRLASDAWQYYLDRLKEIKSRKLKVVEYKGDGAK